MPAAVGFKSPTLKGGQFRTRSSPYANQHPLHHRASRRGRRRSGAPATAPGSVQIPHPSSRASPGKLGFTLPRGRIASGALFMPKETAWRKVFKHQSPDQSGRRPCWLRGWRNGRRQFICSVETVNPTEPATAVFIGLHWRAKTDDDFERRSLMSAQRFRRRSICAATAVSPL